LKSTGWASSRRRSLDVEVIYDLMISRPWNILLALVKEPVTEVKGRGHSGC